MDRSFRSELNRLLIIRRISQPFFSNLPAVNIAMQFFSLSVLLYPRAMNYWHGWVVWALVLCLPFAAVVFWIKKKWTKISSEYRQLPPELIELSKDGIVASRITLERCRQFVKSSLSHGASACQEHSATAAAETLRGLESDDKLAPQWRDVLTRSLTTGRIASVLQKDESGLLYVVAFPGRHEHPRGLRRYAAFSGGWIEHLRDLRQGLDFDSRQLPIHCFILFVRQDARDGVCLYSLSSEETKVAPKQILDERERNCEPWQLLEDSCEVSFA